PRHLAIRRASRGSRRTLARRELVARLRLFLDAGRRHRVAGLTLARRLTVLLGNGVVLRDGLRTVVLHRWWNQAVESARRTAHVSDAHRQKGATQRRLGRTDRAFPDKFGHPGRGAATSSSVSGARRLPRV